ncbi:MAG TPA: nucleoside hydrolase [Micavibrio sp.]
MPGHPLIIDCDTGRDDALSIWVALALGLDVAAVLASYGNTTLNHVCDNCLRVLSAAGRADIPVWRGENMPRQHHPAIDTILLPKQAMSGNGLCNLELPHSKAAAQPMSAPARAQALRSLAAQSGPIDYIILGPATNFATTYQALGAEASQIIKRVTMWGGKPDPLWHQMPGPDFNFGCDPHAVDVLLEAAQNGVSVRFIPMNVTWPMQMTLPQLQALKAQGPVAAIARDLMIAHAQHFAPDQLFRFHDPCVIMSLLHEDYFKGARVRIITDETSADFGRLIAADDGAPVALFEADDDVRADMMAGILKLLDLS